MFLPFVKLSLAMNDLENPNENFQNFDPKNGTLLAQTFVNPKILIPKMERF
jgi:hypothetical protein